MKHRIYIDEVGNPDLESTDNPNHRFLSLTGVIIDLAHVEAVLHPQLEDLKSRYFGAHPDDPIIFHRKEMVNAKPPFEALKDPEVLRQFDGELLGLMRSWDYTVISVCLDKKRHKETYRTWRYDPYHYCLAVLLERFVFFLNARTATATQWRSPGAARKTCGSKMPTAGFGNKARSLSRRSNSKKR